MFDTTQNGFFKNKPRKLTAVAKQPLNSRKYVRGLFLNLRKTCDLVNHVILLNKLALSTSVFHYNKFPTRAQFVCASIENKIGTNPSQLMS